MNCSCGKPFDPPPRTERQDRADMLEVATSFLQWHRCKLCGRLHVRGYVCFHCGEDDNVCQH